MNIEILQKKLQAIEKRCNFWKKENERLVLRQKSLLWHLTKLQSERCLLVDRLKLHKDNYHSAAKNYYSYLKEEHLQVEEGNLISKGASKENEESSRSKKKMSGDNKRKDKWRSKDMPKKPNNPYVQFCLEQRSAIEEEHAAGNVSEQDDSKDKPSLMKILAGRWKQLPEEEKKVYTERYKIDKERYAVEKTQYSANKTTIQSSASVF
ncbi:uncharacterized protein LOC136040080 [Artemia franciscana]|uniref:HMG box domain-containing protein n=1 Tax=Artemia franciscana TaxID=6661 RepID=A0AA88LAT1_ARTSF|nr:hypothetical protein QYM36_008900 [Artemia franciscana]